MRQLKIPTQESERAKMTGVVGRKTGGRVGSARQFIHEKNSRIGKAKKITNSRTAPKGRRAVVSDESVDSISKDMEKRTKKAIRKIGQSTGF